jgi:hypothetical protein
MFTLTASWPTCYTHWYAALLSRFMARCDSLHCTGMSCLFAECALLSRSNTQLLAATALRPLSPLVQSSYTNMLLYYHCLTNHTQQDLRRRFEADGSSATAFAVHPGNCRTDLWRYVPRPLHMMMDMYMRVCFLTAEQVPAAIYYCWSQLQYTTVGISCNILLLVYCFSLH